MTADVDRQADTRIRFAQTPGICAATCCLRLIEAGQRITKRPGSGWQHADCSKPGYGRRRKDRP
jgi:hypothetical protein